MRTSKGDISEENIIPEARGGNNYARRLLYELHIRYLTGVCARYMYDPEDVRDVLQNSFLKVFSSMDTFEYRGKGSLRAWLSKIVVNESLKQLQRTDRLSFGPIEDVVDDIADVEPDVETISAEKLHSLIRELPDGYRTVFNLYVFENKSHREISILLGITENTSASQFHRAKKLLMKKIRQSQKLNQQI